MPSRLASASYISSLLAVVCLAPPPEAVAKTAAPVSEQSSSNQPMLEQVVVTAQKRSQLLQDVPVSVTSISAANLTAQHVTQIADYLGTVPGLSESAGTGGSVSLAIRGITTGAGNNSTVGVTIDDVPVGASTGIAYGDVLVPELDPGVLSSIELLRGPQGTLYGASSMGGLLKYTTTRPDLVTGHGRVEADGSSVTNAATGYSARASGSVPLVTGLLGVSASGFYRRDPGFVSDPSQGRRDVNGADTSGGRLAGLWQISESASLELSALFQHVQGDGSSEIDANANLQPLNGLTQTRIIGSGGYDRGMQLYSANLNVDFGDATLTSVTGYGVGTFHENEDRTLQLGGLTAAATGSTGFGSTVLFTADTRKLTEELRLASPSTNELAWVLGAFYTKEDSSPSFNLVATDLTDGAIVSEVFPDYYPQTYREYAGFADITYHISDRWDLQAGGRYSTNSQTYNETITGPLYNPPYAANAYSRDHAITYLVTPRWRISDNLMTYLRAASGYRPGGPNPGAGFGFPASYSADTTKSYEWGVKSQMLQRRIAVDASVFYIDWSKIQLQQTDLASGFAYYTNAGQARSQGFEVSLEAAPVRGLSLASTVAYTDATLRSATNGTIIGHAGDPLPYTSKWTASFGPEYKFALGSPAVQGFVGTTVRYLGDRPQGFPARKTAARIVAPAYTMLDLRAGITASQWTFTLFAQNVTNTLGILSAAPQKPSGLTGIDYIEISRPRTIGLSAVRTF